MPNLTDAELMQLVDTVKQMALTGQGELHQVNWILGMMLQAFSKRLLTHWRGSSSSVLGNLVPTQHHNACCNQAPLARK